MTHCAKHNTAAVILSGGSSRRMGQPDKSLMQLKDKPILHYVLNTVSPQVDKVFLSINGDAQRFSEFNIDCISDATQTPIGPLGGLHSSLLHIRAFHPDIQWLLLTAADCPFLPYDVREQLSHVQAGSLASYAHHQHQDHYLCSLWSVDCLDDIAQQIEKGNYSMSLALSACHAKIAHFNEKTYNPFLNINTPEDLREAELILDTWRPAYSPKNNSSTS